MEREGAEDRGSVIGPRHDTVMAVRRALEDEGVEFTAAAGRKPGVREARSKMTDPASNNLQFPTEPGRPEQP